MITKSTLSLISFSYSLIYRFSSITHRYNERPFVAQGWVGERSGVRDFLQSGWLMARGVVPFSYDGYQRLCASAAQNQPKLTKQDLMMIIKLGIDYRVRLSPFCHYLQNQIHLRIHKDYELQMQEYDNQINSEIKSITAKFQDKITFQYQLFKEENEEEDDDLGEILQHQRSHQANKVKSAVLEPINIEKQHTEASEQYNTDPPHTNDKNDKKDKNTQQLIEQMTLQLKKRSKREFSLTDLIKVADLLREWPTENLSLIEYLQQLLTIKLQQTQVCADLALSYLKFLTFACQSLMKEYKSHPQKYTVRSIKRIYKYQYFYFQEHLRQLVTSDATATPEFLELVIREYSSFPIKRRSLRNKIAIYTASQINKFALTHRQDLKNILVNINGKDQKMKKQFRTLLGLPEPVPNQPKIQNIVETITQHSTNNQFQTKQNQSKNKQQSYQCRSFDKANQQQSR